MADKNCLLNIRVNRDVRDAFKKKAAEQGTTSSDLIYQYMLKVISQSDTKK